MSLYSAVVDENRREMILDRKGLRKIFSRKLRVRGQYEQLLEDLEMADLGGSKQVRRILRRRQAEIAIAENYENSWSIVLVFAGILLIAWIVLSPIGPCRYYSFFDGPRRANPGLHLEDLIAGAAVSIVSWWPVFLLDSSKPHVRIGYRSFLSYALAAPVIIFGVAYSFWRAGNGSLSPKLALIISGTLHASEGALLVLVLGLGFVLTFAEVIRRRDRRLLQNLVGNTLMRLLYLAQCQTFGELSVRTEMADCLSAIAMRVEFGLPYICSSATPGIEHEARRRASQIAQAYRALIPWVVTPGELTQMDLIHRFRENLRLAVNGRWDLMPIAAEIGTVDTRPLTDRILTAGRVFTIAVLPLAATLLVDRYLQGMNPTVFTWAATVSAFWCVFNLLYLLDPLLANRASTFQSIVESISPLNRKT